MKEMTYTQGVFVGLSLTLLGGLSLYVVGKDNAQALLVGVGMVFTTAWFVYQARSEAD